MSEDVFIKHYSKQTCIFLSIYYAFVMSARCKTIFYDSNLFVDSIVKRKIKHLEVG